MTRPNFEDIRHLGEFQTAFNWDMTIIVPDKLKGVNLNEISMRAQTSTIPDKSNPKIPVALHGFKKNQPGYSEYTGTLDITFAEGVSAIIQKFFQDWQNLNYDPITGVQQPLLGREGTITLSPLDNENKADHTYTVIGCTVEGFTPGSFDGSSQDILKPSVKICYDYFTTA